MEHTAYKEECHEDIKHVCEEHIKVPIEIPVKVPNFADLRQPHSQPHILHNLNGPEDQSKEPNSEFLFPTTILLDGSGPLPQGHPSQSVVLDQFNTQFSRRKRSETEERNSHLISQLYKELLLKISASDGYQIPINLPVKRNSQNILGGSLLDEDSRPDTLGGPFSELLGEQEKNAKEQNEILEEKVRQAMVAVLKDIPSAFENIHLENSEELGIGAKKVSDKAIKHTHPPAHADLSKPVPTVRIVELPSEPGCRSFSHTTCQRIPVIVPEIVPYEECRSVPAVECFFVLKTVDDIECSPRSYEDCTDTAVEVPYLDQEERCEDVEYDDCVDVEEQVPIQVCTRVDPQRKPIRKQVQGSKKRKGGKRTGIVSKPVRGGNFPWILHFIWN